MTGRKRSIETATAVLLVQQGWGVTAAAAKAGANRQAVSNACRRDKIRSRYGAVNDEDFTRMYESGMPAEDVARRCKYWTRDTVYVRASKLGIRRKTRATRRR